MLEEVGTGIMQVSGHELTIAAQVTDVMRYDWTLGLWPPTLGA